MSIFGFGRISEFDAFLLGASLYCSRVIYLCIYVSSRICLGPVFWNLCIDFLRLWNSFLCAPEWRNLQPLYLSLAGFWAWWGQSEGHLWTPIPLGSDDPLLGCLRLVSFWFCKALVFRTAKRRMSVVFFRPALHSLTPPHIFHGFNFKHMALLPLLYYLICWKTVWLLSEVGIPNEIRYRYTISSRDT